MILIQKWQNIYQNKFKKVIWKLFFKDLKLFSKKIIEIYHNILGSFSVDYNIVEVK